MKLPGGTEKAVRNYLRSHYSEEEGTELLKKTKAFYNEFVTEAPAPGELNILRSQYYGGLSVFAFYRAVNGDVSRDDLQKILWSMLLNGGNIEEKHPIRIRFSGTWLQKASYAVLRKYTDFLNKQVDQGRWKNTWKAKVNPEGRKNGISMPLMNCPVAAFARKHGYEHLMPLFCGSDFKVAERYGMRLIREHTEAEGYPDCDFWYLMETDIPE